ATGLLITGPGAAPREAPPEPAPAPVAEGPAPLPPAAAPVEPAPEVVEALHKLAAAQRPAEPPAPAAPEADAEPAPAWWQLAAAGGLSAYALAAGLLALRLALAYAGLTRLLLRSQPPPAQGHGVFPAMGAGPRRVRPPVARR